MSLTQDENHAKFQIKAYEPGRIQVNEDIYTQSLIVAPLVLITDWKPQIITELTNEHLGIIFELEPAILLIGTGSQIHFPPIDIYGDLINRGIGVEIMDTSAACRTYNVLTAEDRNVVAALIIK